MLRNFKFSFLAIIAGLMLAVMGQEVRGAGSATLIVSECSL